MQRLTGDPEIQRSTLNSDELSENSQLTVNVLLPSKIQTLVNKMKFWSIHKNIIAMLPHWTRPNKSWNVNVNVILNCNSCLQNDLDINKIIRTHKSCNSSKLKCQWYHNCNLQYSDTTLERKPHEIAENNSATTYVLGTHQRSEN